MVSSLVPTAALSSTVRPSAHPGRAVWSTPLSSEQESELGWFIINDGCQASRGYLACANLGLVHAIAKNYARLGGPMEELIERGTVGLFRAVDHFDPAHGVRFSTVASWWIKQEMKRVVVRSARRTNATSQAAEQ